MSDTTTQADEPRRSFGTKLLAALMGIGALLAPTAAGVAVLLDPVLKKRRGSGTAGDDGNWIRVASIDQIPPDGVPRQFAVVDPKPTDKWNLYEPQSERPVLLRRTSENETPVALSVTCPHLGCIVSYDAKAEDIVCPCHNAVFDVAGKRLDKNSVSPRDLDPMEVKVDKQTGDVLVNYKRFKGGIAEREAI